MSQQVDQTDPGAAQARYLGNFRRALLEEGIPEEHANDLVHSACTRVLTQGPIEITRVVTDGEAA